MFVALYGCLHDKRAIAVEMCAASRFVLVRVTNKITMAVLLVRTPAIGSAPALGSTVRAPDSAPRAFVYVRRLILICPRFTIY